MRRSHSCVLSPSGKIAGADGLTFRIQGPFVRHLFQRRGRFALDRDGAHAQGERLQLLEDHLAPLLVPGRDFAHIVQELVVGKGERVTQAIVAGGLAVVGLIAAAVVSAKEEIEEEAEQAAEASDTGEVVSDAAAQAMMQAPIAVFGALFSIPGGTAAALGGARLLARNWPLAVRRR